MRGTSMQGCESACATWGCARSAALCGLTLPLALLCTPGLERLAEAVRVMEGRAHAHVTPSRSGLQRRSWLGTCPDTASGRGRPAAARGSCRASAASGASRSAASACRPCRPAPASRTSTRRHPRGLHAGPFCFLESRRAVAWRHTPGTLSLACSTAGYASASPAARSAWTARLPPCALCMC